jgi:predicted proteasome-type protease
MFPVYEAYKQVKDVVFGKRIIAICFMGNLMVIACSLKMKSERTRAKKNADASQLPANIKATQRVGEVH